MRAALRTAFTGCATALALGSASADDLVIVNSLRPGITIKALVLTPAIHKATVILLSGGDGWLAIAGGEPTRLTGNFLVRTREGLHGMGFRTVLVDAPSDRQNPTGLTGGFRQSAAHAQDLKAVVNRLAPAKFITIIIFGITFTFENPDPWAQFPAAVVGTSAGAVSAAVAAFEPGTIVRNSDVAGIGLTAAVTAGADAISGAALNAIRQPVLFVHHVNDGCTASPYIGATAAAFNMMTASVDVSFAEINGGIAIDPDPCQGGALHGFARAGAPALDAIKKWMLTLKR